MLRLLPFRTTPAVLALLLVYLLWSPLPHSSLLVSCQDDGGDSNDADEQLLQRPRHELLRELQLRQLGNRPQPADAQPQNAAAPADAVAAAAALPQKPLSPSPRSPSPRAVAGRRHRRHGDASGRNESHDANQLVPHGSHFHTEEENDRSGGLMLAVLLSVIGVSQLGLVWWRRVHSASYDLCSLFLLWLLPGLWAAWSQSWRLLLVWSAYTAVTGWVMRRALRRQVERSTPRVVYTYFFLCYRACYAAAMSGYLLMMAEFIGLSLLLPEALTPLAPSGLLLLFYGLYFGVVSRDLCQLCSQLMAVNLGYIARRGDIPSKQLPANTCAICDAPLHASVRLTDGAAAASRDEAVLTLADCRHQFHLSCIRGWTIIGKRDTCPCCHEKVQLRTVVGSNPWEQTSLAWGMLLDGMRYMVVWNPCILLIAQTVWYFVY